MSNSNRNLQIALTLTGIAGLVLPFVPFAYDVVPFTDVLVDATLDEALWQMAVPTIVLPLPILLGYGARLLTGRSPRWFDAVGYALALFSMALFLIGAAEDVGVEDPWSAVVLLSVAAFAGGIFSSLRNGAAQGDGLVALQVAYLPPTAFWIAFAFVSNAQIGAWLAVVAASAYSLQILSVVDRRGRTLLLFLPIAALLVFLFVVG